MLLMFCLDKEDYSKHLQNAAAETSIGTKCNKEDHNQTVAEFTEPANDSPQLENTNEAETNRITSQVTAYGAMYEELARARASSCNAGVLTQEENTSRCPFLFEICRMWHMK